MKLLNSFAAGFFLLAPVTAQAALVSIYEAEGEALISGDAGTGFFGEFIDFDFDDIDVAVNGEQIGGLLVSDLLISNAAGDTLLESADLIDSALTINPINGDGTETEDFFTLVFGSLSGDGASLFGDTATVTFSFFEETQDSGLFAPVRVGVFSDLAPIPLPASLPLLGFGLAAMVGLRRRRS
ncbi:VPLPA-CTERM sorting domain-containing protein [uncultured Roseobacter sp.]|uniref:VPLPA-CTERM sorting domain-containing protein n=1 Tax=uncultured Roseobacter sp. TaxID=114847 RepID=UPI00262BA668|nr:VPLPA-CTERM sorting domain-containing protein [uncultured Roseobacter sp.]